MTKQRNWNAAARGVSRAPLSAVERARISSVLARRFADFDMSKQASKADVVDALVEHLLNRQRGVKR